MNNNNWINNNLINFVYILYSDVGYRVGSTKNINARMNTVKLPFPFHRVRVYGTKHHKLLESEFQNIFADKRLEGDWYNLTKII